MTIAEKREKLTEYCSGVRCSECLLRRVFEHGCGYNIHEPEDVEIAYAKLVKLGLISDESSGMKNPVNEAHIAEQSEADTIKIGNGDYVCHVSFDFGWIKGDFPLDGNSDDVIERLRIVSEIFDQEANYLERFVDGLE